VVAVVIVAAIVLPWVLLVSHREPGFLVASTQDALQHLKEGSEGHTAPPGYHLAIIWATFLPWSVLLPMAIGFGLKYRQVPQVRFALAVTLGTWIFCEILQTKLPHYMLCAFPALAFLTADAIVRCLDGEQRDLESAQMRVGAVIWAMVMVVLGCLPWWLARHFQDLPRIAMAGVTGFSIMYGTVVCVLFFARRPMPALISMGVGAMIFAGLLFGAFFPRAQPLRCSINVARVLRQNDVVHPGQVLMLDYKEPSLAFYQGGTIREAKHAQPVMQHVDAAPPWLVLTRDVWDAAPQSSRDRLQIVASFKAFAYSDGLRRPEVMVVRKK
jgi:4-amino-4-deoxy-L-arabinose transferase-like glycosyltransferase